MESIIYIVASINNPDNEFVFRGATKGALHNPKLKAFLAKIIARDVKAYCIENQSFIDETILEHYTKEV
jgi:DNA gyrase/topoisomerase IV subunit B